MSKVLWLKSRQSRYAACRLQRRGWLRVFAPTVGCPRPHWTSLRLGANGHGTCPVMDGWEAPQLKANPDEECPSLIVLDCPCNGGDREKGSPQGVMSTVKN